MKSIFPDDEKKDKNGVAISLGNAAPDQFIIGQLSASTAHLRKENLLGKEIDDAMEIACSHRELGRVLAFQGKIKGAEEELDIAFKLFEKDNYVQSLSVVSAYRSLSALLQARQGKERRAGEALEQARRALEFAEKTVKAQYPYLRNFVQAYWLLGEALVQCRLLGTVKSGGFEIPFYDEHFQRQTHAEAVQTGNEPAAAQRCLHEALRRCRK
ncbi:MAG: tetratricopeptide repeat protein, partial [bacterium]|nr:tetratricopeptide repeat protein [bacterium]